MLGWRVFEHANAVISQPLRTAIINESSAAFKAVLDFCFHSNDMLAAYASLCRNFFADLTLCSLSFEQCESMMHLYCGRFEYYCRFVANTVAQGTDSDGGQCKTAARSIGDCWLHL